MVFHSLGHGFCSLRVNRLGIAIQKPNILYNRGLVNQTMKILVTVKEVATVEDEFEIEGTAIADQYLGADLNEWDDYAVEEAVQLQEAGLADEVVTVTIGPEDCEQTIRQALAKGADRAIRVWDDALEDVDVLDVGAKTDILEAVVEDEDPDLILTGVQSGDDSWGATGVALAEDLGFEWAAVVNHLEHDLDDGVASVRRELEGGVEELTDVELPAVLTIQTGINEPRYASLRGIRQAQRKPLDVQGLGDLGVDAAAVEGAVTLTEMYEPESESDVTVWEGGAEDTAGQLAELLREKGVAP
ncbi:electron transfer flavoprotein subunit beta (plasmid) [Natrarchaeobaculum sulfurireducens]|uniref:Electron transfer flavoprotein subunit beta n=2 Tax=Natrarchaeobaculum sulfurireducens TaxID=2044521 RepID=A0A346P9T2_9EURY|nr:electron transfer flavoprotein subunit beta [Natrarchaeobaculum sulfurireducens]